MNTSCDDCVKPFPQRLVITFGINSICTDCNPVFVQRIREGREARRQRTWLQKQGLGKATPPKLMIPRGLHPTLTPESSAHQCQHYVSVRGFRTITSANGEHAAIRNRKRSAFFEGDPLINVHTIDVRTRQVTFGISSWLMLWRQAAIDGFQAGISMLHSFLETKLLNDCVMIETPPKRKRSDIVGTRLLIGYFFGNFGDRSSCDTGGSDLESVSLRIHLCERNAWSKIGAPFRPPMLNNTIVSD